MPPVLDGDNPATCCHYTPKIAKMMTESFNFGVPHFSDMTLVKVICWLVVWNIFYFPFHIWDNPSHWLSYVSRLLKPRTRFAMVNISHSLLNSQAFHVVPESSQAQSPDAPAVDASTSLKPLHIRLKPFSGKIRGEKAGEKSGFLFQWGNITRI